MSPVVLRPELPTDAPAVHRVNELAFGRVEEASLVDALRRADAVTLSLVAELEGRVVGHILFSPVDIDRDDGRDSAVGLAPMAVLPEAQRHGIGSQLVRAGLDRLRAAGHGAVVVLGHTAFYPRFGFAPAARFGLRWEVPGHDEAFMAVELVPGFLGTRAGVVRYRPEFGAV
ncbi:GNAT family N-acetyltransferase [Polyangium aurulentum]|uniref:GNAT family N-acetyltransferase n=1 Tax=Polyangium aurulentum TaxID=2567896 RepID=UPI0010AEBA86|nr:N-acetyltransferase [Polyangium aurulentum]UQA57280.1 N-acetyltransferase [Polyangium aurulentum]